MTGPEQPKKCPSVCPYKPGTLLRYEPPDENTIESLLDHPGWDFYGVKEIETLKCWDIVVVIDGPCELYYKVLFGDVIGYASIRHFSPMDEEP